MSLNLIKTIFEHLPDCHNWSAHLLAFRHSKRNGSIYNCRLIELEPQGRIVELINEISSSYSGNEKNHLLKYTDLRIYDGTCNGTTIYKIPETGCGITVDLDALLQGIANSDTECDPFQIKANAYILCGELTINGDDHQIKLISMNTPFTLLTNKFRFKNNKFRDIREKVLNLRTSVNVLICDTDIYLLDMSGETLFNMERAYKQRCIEAITEIETLDIVSDIDSFKNIASSGHNPRRFASFSKEKLDLLKNVANRKKVKTNLVFQCLQIISLILPKNPMQRNWLRFYVIKLCGIYLKMHLLKLMGQKTGRCN